MNLGDIREVRGECGIKGYVSQIPRGTRCRVEGFRTAGPASAPLAPWVVLRVVRPIHPFPHELFGADAEQFERASAPVSISQENTHASS